MTLTLDAYATLRDPPPLDVPHVHHARWGRNDPALAAHLQTRIANVMHVAREQMTAQRYHTFRHLQRTHWHYRVEITRDALPAFQQWAEDANAIYADADGDVHAPNGQRLVGHAGADPDAEVPYPADARHRRARTLEALAARSLRVPASLPPVVGEGEVVLRSPDEMAGRMLALMAVAIRGETLNEGDPLPLADIRARLAAGWPALSPKEAAFLHDEAPTRQQTIDAVWRYEALAVLQWALGLSEALPFPDRICDVPECAQRALAWADGTLPALPTPRPAAEILDALDLHLRLHWLVRQAQLDAQAPAGGLIGGVVIERHHALNWLVRFEDADWDDVDTPT
ncbi:DUF4272 domain-containing protein [Luteimonas sp. TWI1437]|uniref:DUF4272 domain-containing protein n=1 Tax=unclassified Luteimonas TaxID=2629088 RepID=UPI0032082811